MVIAGLLGIGHKLVWKAVGVVLILVFVVYIGAIAWTIAKGLADAPELSDSDSDSDDEEHEGWDEVAASFGPTVAAQQQQAASETDALLPTPPEDAEAAVATRHRVVVRHKHSLLYHVALLMVGFLAVLLSAYVLSTAATNLVDEFGLSDVMFGIVVLSIATTLPDKFIAVMSSSKGYAGIMVANTVGGNIFLLSLVIGVLMLSTGGEFDEGSTNRIEIGVMVGSTIAMALIVWLDLRRTRLVGAGMLLAYVVFLVLEFTMIRKE